MNAQIESMLKEHGANLMGFADVAKLPERITGGLPRAVSIAVALNPDIVSTICGICINACPWTQKYLSRELSH